MWSLLPKFSMLGLGGQDVTGESIVEDRSPCEKALILVLPLFGYLARITKDLSAVDPVASNDDYARKLQSFCVSYEMEAGMLRDSLEDIISWWSESDNVKSEEYTDALTDILLLFEGQISREVLIGNQGCLILGDQTFHKLHALCTRGDIGSQYSFPQMKHLVRLPVKDVKRRELLDKLEFFNRNLDILTKDTNNSYITEKPRLDPIDTRPPYEVRTALDHLYRVLDSNWKFTCRDHSHEVKLRLSTFGNDHYHAPKSDETLVGHHIDMMFLTHPPSLRWRQSQVTIAEKVKRHSNKSGVAFSQTAVHPRKVPFIERRPMVIENICATMQEAALRRSCLLLRTEYDALVSENELFKCQLWKIPQGHETPEYFLFSDEEPTITLQELMAYMKNSNTKFTLKERRTLAVILAHSMLHVCESSWLSKGLTKDVVSFLLKAPATADLRRPYLSVKFPKNTTGDITEFDSVWPSSHLSPSLLGLGVLLIELEHGPIEDMRQEDDFLDGKEYSDTNRIAAKRCLENKRLWDQNPYPAFQKAVSACINGKFLIDVFQEEAEEDDGAEENLKLQLAIYNNVTRYLEEELRTIDKQVASDTLNDVEFDLLFEYPSIKGRAVQGLQSFSPPIRCPSPPVAFRTHRHTRPGHTPYSIHSKKVESRVFDSTVLSVPEGSDLDEKVIRAESFFGDLSDIHALLAPGETDSLYPVKVAILDTGIREELRDLNNVVKYYDFVDADFREGNGNAQDKTGHGSDMVYLLHKTAPHAEIYVARVFDGDHGDVGTKEKVALAIEHARDKWKVDIISMSFGFKDGGRCLEGVVKETGNVLMLAASTNFGATEKVPVRYPARDLNRVICVNASDGIGHPASFNPPADPNHAIRNFSILGEKIPLLGEIDADTQVLKQRFGSGTSMATPIAAGVAALVLEFAKQSGVHEKVRRKSDLKGHSAMVSVFNRMSRKGTKDGFHFIAPWKVLSSEAGGYKERMSEVCNAISEAIEGRNDW